MIVSNPGIRVIASSVLAFANRQRLLLVTVLLVACMAAACKPVNYEMDEAGAFPPGTTFAANDWKYGVFVYQSSSDTGTLCDLQNKDVWIRVAPRHGSLLVNDHLGEIRACLVVGKVSWRDFDRIDVALWEEGGSGEWNDSYSQALAKSGGRLLRTVSYVYDPTQKTFVRIK